MKLERKTAQLDICWNRHGGNQESNEAFQAIGDQMSTLRRAVYDFIDSQGEYGATADEVSVALDLMLHTTSARMTDLKASGHLIKVGRRPTRSGNQAGVWIVRK